MKIISKFANEKTAKAASRVLCYVCYAAMIFLVYFLVLGFLGRISFTLHTNTGVYENATYAEKNHESPGEGMSISTTGVDIHVRSTDDAVDPAVQIGLSLMNAFQVVPLLAAYWFLSEVFSNIAMGQIFVEKNAAYLLYYGLLRLAVILVVPLIRIVTGQLINMISEDSISIGMNFMPNDIIPGIAFLVAAYIIHYGIRLQDEVDHTL